MGGVRGRLALWRREEREEERQRSGEKGRWGGGGAERERQRNGNAMERKGCGMILDESGKEERK